MASGAETGCVPLVSVALLLQSHSRLCGLPHVKQLLVDFLVDTRDISLERVTKAGLALVVKWLIAKANPLQTDHWPALRRTRVMFNVMEAAKQGSIEMIKAWEMYCPETSKETLAKIYEASVLVGHVHILQWLFDTGRLDVNLHENLITRFAYSRPDVIHWLLHQFPRLRVPISIDNVARSQTLSFLKWIFKHKSKFHIRSTECAQTIAAVRGDLAMLQWLHSSRIGCCHAWALQMAVSNGHAEVAEWLFEHYQSTTLTLDPRRRNGPQTNHGNAISRIFGALSSRKPSILGADKAIRDAAGHGHLSVVQMLFNAPKSIWHVSSRMLGKKVVLISQAEELRNFATAMERAAANGHLEVVEWLYNQGFRTTNAMDAAARNGHLHVIEWLHQNNAACSPCAMNAAADRNHLSIVQWLHSNRSEGCTTDAMDAAARNGHLELIIWLHENRAEGCTANAMDEAAANGHLQIIRWLHSNRLEGCTENAMDRAAEGGHLYVIQWLHKNRQEGCTFKAMDYAARCGHVEVVQWLYSNRREGYTADAPNLAAAFGHFDLVKWLCINSVERVKPDVIEHAASDGHLGIVKWLHSRFPDLFPALRTDPTVFLTYHAAAINFDLIEWFLDNYPFQMTEESAVYCLHVTLQFPKPPIFSERFVSLESDYIP